MKDSLICGDSELVIHQMTGKYGVKNQRMKGLRSKARELLDKRDDLNVEFKQLPREQNEIADNLANRAIVTKKSAITVNWPNVNRFFATST